MRGLSFCLSFGSYGGFYASYSGYAFRVCLGWVAFTIFPDDIDNILKGLPEA
jgi:hypothetical protein